jgi:hypothetical protein
MLTLFIAGQASASEQEARLSRLAWTALECQELARVAGNQPERKRLLQLGLDATRRFADAAVAGEFSEDELFNFVPGGISDIVRSADVSSAEFMAGRIFQLVVSNTFEKMSERDGSGKRLPPEKIVFDPLELKGIAQGMYRQANCELIR